MTDLAPAISRGAALTATYTPWTPGISVGWTVPGVRSALSDHEQGLFNRSAMLCDAMSRDDRLSATLDVRIAGVLGLPFEMQPADEGSDEPSETAKKLAEQLGADWFDVCPEAELAALLRWYYMLGVGVAELVWETGAAAWMPRLRVHHPQYLRFDEITKLYQLSTEEGEITITPGDGKWVVLTDGERGYMRGLVRSLAIPWMVRTFAWRDWARHSERHGMPIMLVKVPYAAQDSDKDGFVDEIRRLATETTIPLPQFTDGQGFDVNLLEAKANDWEGFERLITACNVSYAVRILGQNLTTEVQGGSYAAATAHERILGDLLCADVQKLTTGLHQQVARPIIAVNSGNVDLTPWPMWNAEPPEDQQAKATVLATLIPALDQAARIGRVIDTEALFEAFSIPVLAEKDREQPAAPKPDGEPLPLAELEPRDTPRTFSDGAKYAADVAASGVKHHAGQMEPFLRKVIAAVESATDEKQLEATLRDLYDERDPRAGAELIRRARVLTQLAGRYAVAGET
jgi:phage gp29-like protein